MKKRAAAVGHALGYAGQAEEREGREERYADSEEVLPEVHVLTIM
jgi:hypothetical protein